MAVGAAHRWGGAGWRLALLGCAALAACEAEPAASSGVPGLLTHAIDPSGAADTEYLDRYVEGRSVVQLGESIHVTDEFPRVRLQLVRRLHERHGFDVLAFEGTAIGSWLAMDLLGSPQAPLDATARRALELAWFGLWQTEPMLEVMKYVASSVGTPNPLYLASFDVQPGSSRAFGGSSAKALDAFFEALVRYEPLPEPAAPERWRDALAPLLKCRRSDPPKTAAERQSGEQAISEVAAWLARARPAVQRLGGELHALALEQIPANLRASLELCERVQGGGIRTYQETRDELNAMRALALRDELSRTRKVMLWAHHSHINYNLAGRNPASMGQHLHERLGGQLYSIGLFAGGGEALEIREGSFIEIAPRQLPPARQFGVEGLLSSLHPGSYFVDLAPLRSSAAWLEPRSARHELAAEARIIPARDFDAAVFVREVHSTRLLMVSPELERKIQLFGWLLDHGLEASVVPVAVLGVPAVALWRRRRRKRLARGNG
jgi:erythromycin esterase